MMIFASDLDNTLIYSYKRDIGNLKRNVEVYQSREISFVTEMTHALLGEIAARSLFVPVTTRSIEQYKRIDFGVGEIEYALVCNGGVLLVNGEKDSAWYKDSLKYVEPSLEELLKGMAILEKSSERYFEVRFIENLFVFTKCGNPEKVRSVLLENLDTQLVDVFLNGEKVYILPKMLDKGTALRRFKNRANPDFVVSAGDSEFDVAMLECSDVAMIPADFGFRIENSNCVILKCSSEKIFSDFVLENVMNLLGKK